LKNANEHSKHPCNPSNHQHPISKTSKAEMAGVSNLVHYHLFFKARSTATFVENGIQTQKSCCFGIFLD
jgi:hypothetical protein